MYFSAFLRLSKISPSQIQRNWLNVGVRHLGTKKMGAAVRQVELIGQQDMPIGYKS
jgi:hypothetical protein